MNRLKDASSPYLRQHADNPVHWWEWSPEAFAEARRRDVPVFLSVGYSSCHWCHVMAHESFEDDATAAVLNEHFVSVKVDREERPDVDSAYMGAVQALTGRGGWPMSVFTTPDGTPFFGGTYWPPDDRHGMPGFRRVLDAVLDAWRTKRADVVASGRQLAAHLEQAQELGEAADRLDMSVADRAASRCVQLWDDQLGGFGQAPKFPQAMTIDFLYAHHLRTGDEAALRAASHSLEAMSRGGIYDHVGGGFARYSVDAHWLVPHFEKMLYDNALLLRAYAHASSVEPEEQRRLRFARVARETADYLLTEMRHPDGGLYSATDADSEGIEGKFFAWSLDELSEVVGAVGEDPAEWTAFFGVTAEGNFADPHHPEWGRHNVLSEPVPRDETDSGFADRLSRVRTALAERRATRVPPGLDDKVLTSWNALAFGALAEAGALLGEPRYVKAAQECAGFLQNTMVQGSRLLHTWRAGHGASVRAFLEDVAYLAQALLVLYEADHDDRWLAWAARLAAEAHSDFAEVRDGAFTGAYHSTAHDAEALVVRPKDLWDNATPAGPSVMVDVGLRLFGLTGDGTHRDRAEQTLRLLAGRAEQAPTGYGELLRGLERLAAGPREVAIVGAPDEPATRALVAVHHERWRPEAVLAVGEAAGSAHPVPLLHERGRVDGNPAAYVCRDFTCDRPVTTPEELRTLLDG